MQDTVCSMCTCLSAPVLTLIAEGTKAAACTMSTMQTISTDPKLFIFDLVVVDDDTDDEGGSDNLALQKIC